MREKAIKPEQAPSLREQAEIAFQKKAVQQPPSTMAVLATEEVQHLLHELQVHQIELEMQNEELLKTQSELNTLRANYFDLYDLAPVGYITVTEAGVFLEANLMASTLFGVQRGALIGKSLSRFIVDSEQDSYYLHRRVLCETDKPQEWEMRMINGSEKPFWAHLVATRRIDVTGSPVLRIVLNDITKRRLEEEAKQSLVLQVQAEKNRLTLLIDNLVDEVWFADTSGKFTLVNPVACRNFNLEKVDHLDIREFAGSLEVFHPDGSPRPIEEAPPLLALKGKTTIEMEEIVRLPPIGDYHYRLVSATPVKDAQGGIIGCVSIVHDITELKLAQKSIEESEEKFRDIFEFSPIGKTLMDMDGTIHTNRAFAEMLGYPMEELEKGGWEKLTYPDDIQKSIDLKESLFNGKIRRGSMEKRYMHRDGSIVWVQLTSTLLKKSDGTARFFISSFENITERKQMVNLLRETNEYLDKLISNTNVPTIVWDPQFKVTRFNQAFETLTCIKAETVLGSDVGLLFPEDRREECLERIRSTTSGDHKEPIEVPILSKDGVVHIVLWSSSSIYEPDEKTVKETIAQGQDITKRKQTEDERIRLNKQLKDTLENTTTALSMAFELRDPYTANHQRRVADLACRIWKHLGLPDFECEGLRIAGLLHDLGKLTIPSEILTKPSKLSPLEFAMIREHPVIGWDILRLVEFPWPVATIIRQHHERLDGTGYPDGLKGEAILKEARILIVADIVEAMASHRPYRPALGLDAALNEITKGRGIAFDAEAVDACIALFREDGYMLLT